MTTEDGSVELKQRSSELAARLRAIDGELIHGDVYNVQHGDFATQARRFVDYVESALLLVDQTRFAQAFSLLRSAMEQWAIDAITMLGDRYVRMYPGSSEEQLAVVLKQWTEGELPWIAEEPKLVGKGGTTLRVVHRGLTNPDDGTVLHPLYFEADRFDPFFGTPDEQEDFAGWLGPEQARDHAAELRRRYNLNFRWGAIVETLVLNSLVQPQHVVHLDVHYRFLSAFVHSQKLAHDLLERSPVPPEPVPNHATVELALLYSAQLLAWYTNAFIAMTERPPEVNLVDKDDLREQAEQLLSASSHLWFLDDNPHNYDRGQELGARVVEQLQAQGSGLPQVADDFDNSEIRYYRNPLERLRRMHTGFNELATGFVYQPTWE